MASEKSNIKREKFTELLRELFQLNQPELDFGLYKIMHAKSAQITKFLESDLLVEIEQAFGENDSVNTSQMKEQAIAKLKEALGDEALDDKGNLQEAFKNIPAGKKYLEEMAAAEAAKDTLDAESEIYDHLYRFFERYYDSGDFMSRRYYARESDARAAPYSVPYDGREVYLHWANKDQYYIKSSEYLSNYTFELNEAIKLEADRQKSQKGKAAKASEAFDFDAPKSNSPLKVNFKIVEASEGEHGNIKAASDQKRFFIIHTDAPVLLENDELIIQFQYRSDDEKTGQDNVWQQKRLQEAEAVIIEGIKADNSMDKFLQALQLPAPTDKQKQRSLLGKYLQKYAARNTMDYFIHKDLGSFMRRELDFYIKNEIMRLDDIENSDAPKVEHYLSKIRVLRRIAHQLITFLAQLEDFQKKLWLKKKFVTETNYCITLDRIPESFYVEIASNDKQREEWVKLFAIDDIKTPEVQDLLGSDVVSYSAPLSVEFLKANSFLLVDTVLFEENFKQKLLAEIPDLDAQCDGVLVHSENFQALGLMQQKYNEQVKCIYIDPPYNTGSDGFPYKDNYQHASWLSMIYDRLMRGKEFAKSDAAIISSIDEVEQPNLRRVLDATWGAENYVSDMVWAAGRKNDSRLISVSHEYMLVYARNKQFLTKNKIEWKQKKKGLKDIYSQYKKIKKLHGNDFSKMTTALKLWYKNLADGHPAKQHKHYSSVDKNGVYFPADISWPGGGGPRYEILHPITKKPVKIPSRGWMTPDPEKMQEWINQDLVHFGLNEESVPCIKSYLKNSELQAPYSVFYQDGRAATKRLRHVLGTSDFGYPKDEIVISESISMLETDRSFTLDYFAGSGTTGHAVINLNREDNGKRKYILVEQSIYFDTVLKPRIQKVVYSKDWKDGKPVSREGISHCFKYMRLESYEDAVNNMVLKDDSHRDAALEKNPAMQRDYLLNYFLDVETSDSQSLLNIEDFRDPMAYQMQIKKPGSEEQALQNIDLIETFNWLIGLWVQHMGAPHSFSAEFEREKDADLPKDQNTRLICKRLKSHVEGDYWFRLIEGYTLKVPGDETSKVKTLIVWRKQTDDAEKDNAVLQKFLIEKLQISPREQTYDVIYINGSHTLPNPVVEGEQTKVRLIEEAFHNAMWAGENV